MELARQRCFNHADREAVAHCLDCGHFYCRECITEHQERVICAACLRVVTKRRRSGGWFNSMNALSALLGGAGLFILFLVFYVTALCLLSVPDMYHQDRKFSELLEEFVMGD